MFSETKTAPNKQVQIAFVQKEISKDDGQGLAFGEANDFIAEAKTLADFDRLQKAGKYLVREDLLRESSVGLSGIDNSRKLIFWAFSKEAGDMSELELIGDQYVVAIVGNARKPGPAELKTLKGDPSFEALAKRDKKAQMLIEQMTPAVGAKIEDAGTKLNAAVLSSGAVNLNSYSVPGMGNDPAVLGAAAGVAANKVYGPIEGRNGVYIIVVDSKTVGTAPPVYEPNMKRQFAAMAAQKVMNLLQSAIMEDANVRDMRYKMYQ